MRAAIVSVRPKQRFVGPTVISAPLRVLGQDVADLAAHLSHLLVGQRLSACPPQPPLNVALHAHRLERRVVQKIEGHLNGLLHEKQGEDFRLPHKPPTTKGALGVASPQKDDGFASGPHRGSPQLP